MRVAIISAVRGSWSEVPAFLDGLRAILSRDSSLDASVWLIDDAGEMRPPSWHALDAKNLELHVIELHGRQGRDRAFAAALGTLLCDLDERFDAYLLLDVRESRELQRLDALFEAALRHPGTTVLAPGGPAPGGPLSRIGYGAGRLLLRLLSGERLSRSPALLLSGEAAEALCHSGHGASQLEAALLRLRVRTVPAAMPGGTCGLDMIAAASVFRDRVFSRIFAACAWLGLACALSAVAGAALRLGRGMPLPYSLLAALAVITVTFGAVSVLSLLLGLFSQSLDESRRWTAAIDSALLVREITRVKRQPYAMPAAASTRPRHSFAESAAKESCTIPP